ncbi:MAG: NAD(P)/FAD-dependent oxidoreductase [Flammeovirgaceae bacterium]
MKKINVPDTNLPRIVIIGGGFGGLKLAKALSKAECQVVLFDRNNYHTFQPLLYQVATAGLEPDSIAFPVRKIFKKQSNFFFRMAEVTQILPDEQLVHTNIGDIRYDELIIATGSRTNFFGLKNVKKHAMPLKSVVQALDLRSMILQNFEQALIEADIAKRESKMTFVIVGGGPTGVELAGALGELKRHVLPNDYPELDVRRMQIHLIEAGPALLGGMEKNSSKKALDYLKKLGVHVWLNTFVTDYDGQKVKTNIDKEILAKNFIWSAGVEGNMPEGLVEQSIGSSNRIKVDQLNQVEGHQNIYAIGDVALMVSDEYPKGHPMVAPVAMQQGQNVAKNIKRKLKGKEMKPFVYYDKGSMATVGRNKAVVEIGKFKSQGAFAWFTWMFVHLISLAGFRNKMVTLINWLWNFMNYDRGIRLIIRPFNRLKSPMREESTEEHLEV